MSQAVIAVNNLNKTVPTAAGDLIILDDVNLEVEKGEAVAIVGSSGSGKTTLLGILAGLDSATSGSVRLMEAQLSDMNEEERAIARGKYTGFIFQSFQLLMSLTARENVMLPAELRGDEQAESQALELLEKVGLDSRLNHYPNQLSGGEQQRVAIARAFASRPEIMFADEPTGNLDTKTGSLVTELLFDLNREFGTTLVLVTHDTGLASRCDRTISIASGRVVL
jgi:putative ABC transport system ATP-binding protein